MREDYQEMLNRETGVQNERRGSNGSIVEKKCIGQSGLRFDGRLNAFWVAR
jgi:hypothetical protein